MKRAYLFLMILFVALACENQEAAPRTLAGKWEWVSTDGGIANHIHETPQASGKAIVLELDNNLTYREYLNGTLSSQGTYFLSKGTCIHDHQEKDVLTFSGDVLFAGQQHLMVERLNNLNLYLSDENADGVESRFKLAAAGGN
ncbi:MAG: hypothetical protein ACO1O1_14190 [Adhaeribacter sp.]